MRQRRRATDVLREQFAKLPLELRVSPNPPVGLLQLHERRHERLAHVAASV